MPAKPVPGKRRDAAPPSDVPMAERDVMVVRGREGEAAAMGGVLSARGVGRDAIVGARPPLGGHVLQRASVDDGLKTYVHMLVPSVGQININHHHRESAQGHPPIFDGRFAGGHFSSVFSK